MRKVFGIGVHKTGTTTLAECLKILGYNVCPESLGYPHREAVTHKKYLHTLELVQSFDAFVDSPWNYSQLYPVLASVYPDSLFILTVRDFASWWTSIRRWIDLGRTDAYSVDVLATIGTELTPENYKRVYEAYLERQWAVEKYFDAEEYCGRLLSVCWETGDGWPHLCNFLNLPQPNVTLPWMLRYDNQQQTFLDNPAQPIPEEI